MVGTGVGKGNKVDYTTWKAVSDPLIMFPQKFQGSTSRKYNSLAWSPGELYRSGRRYAIIFSYCSIWWGGCATQTVRITILKDTGFSVGWFEILPVL